MAESKVMNATDLMTRSVVSIRPDASILDAARLMLYHKISGLPMVEAGGTTLVGIVTEGDFLRRAEIGAARRRPPWIEFFTAPGRLAEEYVHASGRKVHEVMSTELCTVTEETALPEIARLMEDRGIKRVPVVQGRELVGIVSRADLLRAAISLESILRNAPEATSRLPKLPDASGLVRLDVGLPVTLAHFSFPRR